MQASTLRRRNTGGVLLALLGASTLALALLALLLRGGGDEPGAPTSANVSPVAATSEAVAFWEARVAQDPADFVALNRLAGAYIQRGRETGDVSDYTRAQAAVDSSLASLPGDNPRAYSLLATLQNIRHEFAASLESARTAAALDPADIAAPLTAADAMLALGRYDEAFAAYLSLVDRAPSLATFSRLAVAHELRGDLAEAEAAWENALSTDGRGNPEATAWAHFQFGNFYFSQGDLEAAASRYAGAADAFPGYIHALAGEARIASARQDYDRAITLYTAATERQPIPEYIAALGDVYAAAGRDLEADRQYALIDAIGALYSENGIGIDLQMAVFLADHDLRPAEALAAAQAAYEQQPGSIYAADAVAWALYKNDRAEEALPYVERAMRLGTRDAGLFFHAGMIHHALGDDSAARGTLESALAINPHFSVLNAPIAERTLDEIGR